MNDPVQLWADPRLVYTVAGAAAATLLFTIWLFGRRKRGGRPAGVICLMLSIGLHAALIFLVPMLPSFSGGSSTADPTTDQQAGIDSISFSTFDPDMIPQDASGEDADAMIAPLPVSNLTDLLTDPVAQSDPEPEPETADEPQDASAIDVAPESLVMAQPSPTSQPLSEIDTALGEFLDDAFAESEAVPDSPDVPTPESVAADASESASAAEPIAKAPVTRQVDAPSPVIVKATDPVQAAPVSTTTAPGAMVAGDVPDDFANRVGKAKEVAIQRTGGDANTEAAVEAALKFLAETQRPDGAWDPRASGAGKERAPLGMTRGNAGAKAETAITGLALLTLMGAGQTHQQGPYADNAYRGLAYLIQHQQPNGSLAGNASVYAATYSHGMAALAMCETAAITRDPSAIQSATRSINFTRSMQHPSTGGWRYTAGDPGDLSQLGWQAMVLDAGYRAGVPVDRQSVTGVQRFLRSVRAGSVGGLASYRAGEAPSRTMTAEALATRLLIGEKVPPAEIAEAQRYLMQQPPGVGQDNYYYWYYATLALHQLQDETWQQWNTALKNRLLATQRSDGSWPADTVWGGYGGTIYTTAMATLCLEVYYRHTIRSDSDRIANQINQPSMR
ncbi:hypothetical protein K227x_20090 [Rubripirellula lacrimiformis]|uniref:Uncharacterized protein n=1 Tax=Rubripirellula lacrimiformis TaxID=1930273 RepID=A0A517N909_9BACT|nr:prenyltransferase/squalene oxidase repeat-containing protein [Rubripirellula lacrimiformis]QDT03625.1 hypothetical protein K227x_20090 [Rubripirellula lacrimiformis]